MARTKVMAKEEVKVTLVNFDGEKFLRNLSNIWAEQNGLVITEFKCYPAVNGNGKMISKYNGKTYEQMKQENEKLSSKVQ